MLSASGKSPWKARAQVLNAGFAHGLHAGTRLSALPTMLRGAGFGVCGRLEGLQAQACLDSLALEDVDLQATG